MEEDAGARAVVFLALLTWPIAGRRKTLYLTQDVTIWTLEGRGTGLLVSTALIDLQ
jgi:hypothetical protein